jgi:hypothetical protein
MLRLNIRYERRYGSSAFSDFDQRQNHEARQHNGRNR